MQFVNVRVRLDLADASLAMTLKDWSAQDARCTNSADIAQLDLPDKVKSWLTAIMQPKYGTQKYVQAITYARRSRRLTIQVVEGQFVTEQELYDRFRIIASQLAVTTRTVSPFSHIFKGEPAAFMGRALKPFFEGALQELLSAQ